MSVYLTDISLGTNYGCNVSPTQSKADQLLSALHSISVLPIKYQHFYISYSDNYLWAENIINNQINQFFPNAVINNYSLETFQQWKDATLQIPSDVDQILLKTNHDHVYTPESSTDFEKFSTHLEQYKPRYIGEITHWPEFICLNRFSLNSDIAQKDDYQSFHTLTTDAIGTCLVSKELFLEWWVRDFTQGKKIIRPDNPFGPSIEFQKAHRFLPSTELFRHLDGYGHIGIKTPIAGPIRACCQIENNVVKHQNWSYGKVGSEKRSIDLPRLPKRGLKNDIQSYLNLLKLVSALEINFKNTKQLFSLYQEKNESLAKLYMLLLFDKFFLVKSLKAILRKLLKL
jgi:hypothetical protein